MQLSNLFKDPILGGFAIFIWFVVAAAVVYVFIELCPF